MRYAGVSPLLRRVEDELGMNSGRVINHMNCKQILNFIVDVAVQLNLVCCDVSKSSNCSYERHRKAVFSTLLR